MPENTTTQNGSTHDLRARGTLPDAGGRNADEHSQGASPAVLKATIGICLKGHTPPESYHDRMLMHRYLGMREAEDFYLKRSPRFVFNFVNVGEIFVPFAREMICDNAIKMSCDYVFMIDDDMMAPEDLFFKLAAHNKDIVAALAFTRNPPHHPVIYESTSGYDPVTLNRWGMTQFVHNYPRNQLVECDAVGFGAVLIKTSVLKKIEKPWFMGSHGAGEDITFCVKAKELGCRIYMDTTQKLGHLSHPLVVNEDYVDKFRGMTDAEREKFHGPFMKYAEASK